MEFHSISKCLNHFWSHALQTRILCTNIYGTTIILIGVGVANSDLVVAGQVNYQTSTISEVTWVLRRKKVEKINSSPLQGQDFYQLKSQLNPRQGSVNEN